VVSSSGDIVSIISSAELDATSKEFESHRNYALLIAFNFYGSRVSFAIWFTSSASISQAPEIAPPPSLSMPESLVEATR
jgi:hypothetical protein